MNNLLVDKSTARSMTIFSLYTKFLTLADTFSAVTSRKLLILSTMDFYLYGHIKRKVYVKKYQSLADLNSSISAAFREVTAENVSASVRNVEKRLKMVIERDVLLSINKLFLRKLSV